MKPFPVEQSVLILDNCRIHHNEELPQLIENAGVYTLFVVVIIPLTPVGEAAYFSTSLHTLQISTPLKSLSVPVCIVSC